MGKFADRIRERKRKNQIAFEQSFLDLAGINSDEDRETRENFLVSQVAKFFNLPNYKIPNNITGIENKFNYLLNNYGLLGRKIELKEGWQFDNRTPVLAFFKDNGYPIILLPKGHRKYYCVSYKNGEKTTVGASFARRLRKDAYIFYKPLPTHKLTFKEYFKFFRKAIIPLDLVLVALFTLMTTAIGMLLPYLMKRFTGEVVQEKDLHLFWVVATHVISAGIAHVLIKAAEAFMNARVAIRIEKLMQETTMMRLLSLPPSFYKKYNTGELTTRFNSVSALSSLIFNGVFLTLLSSVMSLAYMTQIVQFAPSLVLPVILILLITLAFSVSISLLTIKVSRKQMLLASKENGTAYALINGIQKIRLAGAEKRAFARWAKDYAKSSELLYHPPLIIRLAPAIAALITLLGEIAIYFIAAKNNIDVSSYIAFTSSFASLTIAVSAASEITNTFARLRPVLDMARPILEEESEDTDDKMLVETLEGRIKLDHISFKYEEDGPDILKDINLDIKEGEYVGVVGKTGCGKSTLVRLLLGFEKPTNGHLYFDEKDINTLNLQSLRSKVGSVTQNGGVFHADIMSNILITSPNLGENEAWEAAEIAGIADDIRNMPMGMRTVISEGQGGISGGQKQRIMIARAIVNKPKVLIFDEATSALDNKTQKSVADSISGLNCTRIVIAHRLSTIQHCDRIIFMENGSIKESGTYDELIREKGKFYELVERQRLDND